MVINAPYAPGDPGPLCTVEQATNTHDPLRCGGCAQRRRDRVAKAAARDRIGDPALRLYCEDCGGGGLHWADCPQFIWFQRVKKRANVRPLLAWAIAVFLVGAIVGASISFASSVLSSSGQGRSAVGPAGNTTMGTPDGLGSFDGSTVRASGDRGRGLVGPSEDRHLPTLSGGTPAFARTTSLEDTAIEPTAQTTEALIRSAALRHGVDPAWIARVIFCESSNNTEAIGDGGLSIGLAQYQARTFLEHSRISGLGYTLADYGDPTAQLDLMSWAFSHGLSNAWTCAR